MTHFRNILRLNIKSIFNVSKSFISTQNHQSITKIPIFSTFTAQNNWIYQQNYEIKTPFLNIIPKIDTPKIWTPKISPEIPKFEIIEPEKTIEKHAVKLIVIRKHKMRKHKLKKLRKKMKFEWAKRRQKREMKKEKLFQGTLLTQIKEAEKFSAEYYVFEKIQKATEVPIPRFWKGKRLPEFIIREKLNLPPK